MLASPIRPHTGHCSGVVYLSLAMPPNMAQLTAAFHARQALQISKGPTTQVLSTSVKECQALSRLPLTPLTMISRACAAELDDRALTRLVTLTSARVKRSDVSASATRIARLPIFRKIMLALIALAVGRRGLGSRSNVQDPEVAQSVMAVLVTAIHAVPPPRRR